jgi:hypothetical protein
MARIILLPFILLAGACAGEKAPVPAPGQVERLLVRLETNRQDEAAQLLTDKQRERLARAERLVAPLEKLPAEKIDPSVAEALIAR